MIPTRAFVAVLLALSLAVVTAGAVGAHPGIGKYQDVQRAIDDGYAPTEDCVPGMGYHYINFALFDGEVKVSHPEVLVYANGADGLELVAVEYIAPTEFEILGTHSHVPFPGAPFQAVHAWFFLPNPDGLTADTNSRIDANCNIVG